MSESGTALPVSEARLPPIEAVFEGYLREWSRRVVRRSRRGGHPVPAEASPAVVVLPFAGAHGVQSVSIEGGERWRPTRLLRAVAELVRETAGRGAFLTEEDPVQVDRLVRALRSVNADIVIGATEELPVPSAGKIVVLHGAFTTLTAHLEVFGSDAPEVLFLCAPPDPAALPLFVVRSVAEHPGTDTLVHFPTKTLRRLERFRNLPVADLPPMARRAVDGYSVFLGDPRYRWLKEWREAHRTEGTAPAERLVRRYRDVLRGMIPTATVKHVHLDAAREGGAPSDLFLLTHRPTRALRLNRVLRSARLRGDIGWPAATTGYVTEEPTGVLDLFGASDTSSAAVPASRVRRVDLAGVTHFLTRRFRGAIVPFEAVVRVVADTELFVEDVRRALSMLKHDRRVRYRALDDESVVDFRGGPLPESEAGRRRNAPATLELGLSEPPTSRR